MIWETVFWKMTNDQFSKETPLKDCLDFKKWSFLCKGKFGNYFNNFLSGRGTYRLHIVLPIYNNYIPITNYKVPPLIAKVICIAFCRFILVGVIPKVAYRCGRGPLFSITSYLTLDGPFDLSVWSTVRFFLRIRLSCWIHVSSLLFLRLWNIAYVAQLCTGPYKIFSLSIRPFLFRAFGKLPDFLHFGVNYPLASFYTDKSEYIRAYPDLYR